MRVEWILTFIADKCGGLARPLECSLECSRKVSNVLECSGVVCSAVRVEWILMSIADKCGGLARSTVETPGV